MVLADGLKHSGAKLKNTGSRVRQIQGTYTPYQERWAVGWL